MRLLAVIIVASCFVAGCSASCQIVEVVKPPLTRGPVVIVEPLWGEVESVRHSLWQTEVSVNFGLDENIRVGDVFYVMRETNSGAKLIASLIRADSLL